MLLHEGTMAVTHPLFGTIRINDKFQEVLKLKPFWDLSFKSQLGTIAYLGDVLNARHTRKMHSIGVMYLIDKLLDTIERKYSKKINITKEERETLELVALGHDIGHLAFSHSMENKALKSHETRTVELFEQYAIEINSIFGYDITSNVLKVFEYGKGGKERNDKANESDLSKANIVKLCIPMLMGTVDCDRMEYLMTDRYMLTGNHVDYSRIFESVSIAKVNDSYTIAFEKEALSLIEDMLMTRVRQYEDVYCTMEDTVTKSILTSYVAENSWCDSYIYMMQEYDILSHMHSILRLGNKKSIAYHLALMFLNGNYESILRKKFTNYEVFEDFTRKLYAITDDRNNIRVKWYKFRAYLPEKETVYIKEDDGTICNLADVSLKLRDCSTQFGYVMVDIDSAYKLKEEEVRSIRNLYEE